MKMCEKCIHNEVCCLKEKLEMAKSEINFSEDYNNKYPFVQVDFYCTKYNSSFFELTPVEKMIKKVML
jgi:hypothetical protein